MNNESKVSRKMYRDQDTALLIAASCCTVSTSQIFSLQDMAVVLEVILLLSM